MAIFTGHINVRGEIEIEISARDEESARAKLDAIADKLFIDNKVYRERAIKDVQECVTFDLEGIEKN